jgi:hypothetical protein
MSKKIFNNTAVYFEGFEMEAQTSVLWKPLDNLLTIDFIFTIGLDKHIVKGKTYKLTSDVFGELSCIAENMEIISDLDDVVRGWVTFKIIK